MSSRRHRNRTSLGGSSLFNTRSSSAPPRRMSFDPSDKNADTNPSSPKKDRRAMLEEWRQQARNKTNRPVTISSSAFSDTEEGNENKRPRHETPPLLPTNRNFETPPLPPTSLPTPPIPSSGEGSTALARFRARRAAQQMEIQGTSPGLPPHPPSSDGSAGAPSPAREVGGSKLLSRGRLSVGGKSRRRSFSTGAMRRTRNTNSPSEDSESPPNITKPPIQSSPQPDVSDLDSIESSGLKSRLIQMQTRITQLEREKLDLTKSHAPLEARLRQREQAWNKEQARLLQDIDDLKAAAKEADERYRELEVEKNAAEEERSRYKYEALKATSCLRSDEGVFDVKIQNEREIFDLKEKLRDAQDEIKTLRLEKISLESDLDATQRQLQSSEEAYEDLREEYDDLEARKSKNSDAEIQLKVLTTEHIATSAQLNAVCADLAATKSSAKVALDEKEKELKGEISDLKFEISVLKTRSVGNMSSTQTAEGEMIQEEDEAVLKARIEERDARISELEAQVIKGEKIRRIMHNRIQELRGNIRVYVRTRPFLPGDGVTGDSSIEVLPDGESLVLFDKSGSKDSKFTFDKVFPPSSGQDAVFDEVSDFVQSALDGYHVCLFSYGQTGSGKTHTMQGSGNGAMRGIIPRAVAQILAQAKVLQNQKWQFHMTASFLEIYNEDLRDLLTATGKKTTSSGGMTTRSKQGKLAIKRDSRGKSFVDGLNKVTINTEDSQIGMQQLDDLMSSAARARSVASTNMNSQSSRSHSVFMLHLHGQNEDSGTIVQGALNLCDLAGSERLDRSGAGSDIKRLKETQAINKSLSCLGDVFNALANGSSHIPFRNSKLTYLLQDCLSGDGKALMFVNLSPTLASSGESLCSLRFAQRVNQVELGKPTKHVHYKTKK